MRTLFKTYPAIRAVALILLLALLTPHAQAQRALGIDVSSYQGGAIDWNAVRASGVIFAWTKATESTTHTDVNYAGNIANAKAAGVYIGAYDFAHPELNTPAAEAGYYWGVTGANFKNDALTLSPMLDMEVFTGIVGATSYSDWVNQWCNVIMADAAGQSVKTRPCIYFSACHGGQFDTSISQWFSDIANYNGQNPLTGTAWSACASQDSWGSSIWHFWQYSSTLPVSGISDTTVDHDVFNGTAGTLLATMVSGGYTNYPFDSNSQGWTSGSGLTGLAYTASGWPGIIYADQNANNAYFNGPTTTFIGQANASVNVSLYIQAATAPHDMQVQWKTAADNAFSAAKSTLVNNYTFPNTWTRINLDVNNNAAWIAQNINQLRLNVDSTNHGNRFLVDSVKPQTSPRYAFTTSGQGWSSGNSMGTIAWTDCCGWPGILYADQTGDDCNYIGPTAMNYWGANNDRVHVRVYPQGGNSGGVHDAQLFWNTTTDGAFSEAKSSGIISFYGNDQFIDIYFNVGLNTWWNGNNNGAGSGAAINQLRLDFDNINHATRWIVDSIQIEHVNYDLPTITAQPVNKSIPLGGTTTLSVTGNGGNSPLSYQWWRIGSTGATIIPGANASTLTITNAQPTDATNYLATVSNAASLLNSTIASLTVTANPPTSVASTTMSGTNLTLNITATPGQHCVLQCSTDLVTWTEVTNAVVSASGTIQFTPPLNPSASQQYFRIKTP